MMGVRVNAEIATHLSGARNDTGTEKGLAMTREASAVVKNTGITKAHQTTNANMEPRSYQAFALAH
jgi:hypothetical protein